MNLHEQTRHADPYLQKDLEETAASSIVTENLTSLRGRRVLITGVTGLIGSLLVRNFAYLNEKHDLHMTIYGVARNLEKAEEIYADYLPEKNDLGSNAEKPQKIYEAYVPGNPEQAQQDYKGENSEQDRKEESLEQADRLVLSQGIVILRADVTDPDFVPKMRKATEDQIDYIFHAAAVTQSKLMVTKPIETIDAALSGTKNLLSLAAAVDVQSFVYISSMEVYGDMSVYGHGPIRATEDELGYIDPQAVRSDYPESKRMCENLCTAYHEELHVPVKTARLAQTFGAGVLPWEKRVFAQFAQAVIDGKDIVLHTKGLSEGNYCYSADCVRGLLTILLKGENGEAYNVVNEHCHTTIGEMAKMVAGKFGEGKSKVVVDIPENNAYGYAADTKLFLDGGKLRHLGWKAEADLPEMYRRLIGSMRWQQGKQSAQGIKSDGSGTQEFMLRPATAGDCRLLYEWRNDPVVRQNSFHTEPIAYEDHQKWFARMMQDPDQRQYILMAEREPAGQVRIRRATGEENTEGMEDRSSKRPSVKECSEERNRSRTKEDPSEEEGIQDIWEISYSIAEQFRGHGLGEKMLQLLEDLLRDEKNSNAAGSAEVSLLAQVKPENAASRKIFEKLGYEAADQTREYAEYRKTLRP